MFTVSTTMVILLYIISFDQYYSGATHIMSRFWIIPLNFGIGALIFIYINNLIRKPLDKSIGQIKGLSEGNLQIEVSESGVKNELGLLNNSLMNLTLQLKRVIFQVSQGAENVAGASRQ